MSNSDVIVQALEVLPLIDVNAPSPPVIRALVMEVIALREELAIMITRARVQGWPDIPTVPIPELPPATPKQLTDGAPARKTRKPRVVARGSGRKPKSRKTQNGVKRHREGPIADRQLELLRAICKDPGKRAADYSKTTGMTMAMVYTYAGHLRGRKLIASEGGEYSPTDAGKKAAA